MCKLISWEQMKVACYYSRAQNRLPSHPLSAILPGRCMQLTYNLSAPALEDSQYKIESMRHSTRLEQDCILHETIILEFRYFSTAPRPLLAACVGTQKIDLASDPAGHAPIECYIKCYHRPVHYECRHRISEEVQDYAIRCSWHLNHE